MASIEDVKVGPTTLTAVTQEVRVSKPGMATATFQLAIASGTITLAFEVLTQEGPTPVWEAVSATRVSTGVSSLTASAAGLYRVSTAGFRSVRARVTATTGSATLTGNASTGTAASGSGSASGVTSAPVVLVGGSTATRTAVAAAAADTLILAANPARLGATVYNQTTNGILHLGLGTAAASLTDFTKKLVALEYYEIPFGFTGQVRGRWSIADGFGFVTEVTA